jgi:tripartite-type tricarboxylate transporter receptor subunit TctC
MNHIPYKGSGILITDLVSGRVDLSFQVPITVLSHIQAGKLKPIAITGETRAPALSEVPTFAESGVQGFSTGGWFGIVMRTATPSLIINKISSDMAVVLANQESKDYLIKQGSEAFTLSSSQVNALIRADIAKFAKIIKDANIKL